MTITVAEKEHWKARIQKKISSKVEAIKRSDPEYFQDLEKQAHKVALERLEISEKYSRIDLLSGEISRLQQDLDVLKVELLDQLTGKKNTRHYGIKEEIDRIVSKYQDEEKEKLLKESKLGLEVLQLEEEKDNLLDTVWLATSPKQVRDLWEKVSELLGDETTPIQREIFTKVNVET